MDKDNKDKDMKNNNNDTKEKEINETTTVDENKNNSSKFVVKVEGVDELDFKKVHSISNLNSSILLISGISNKNKTKIVLYEGFKELCSFEDKEEGTKDDSELDENVFIVKHIDSKVFVVRKGSAKISYEINSKKHQFLFKGLLNFDILPKTIDDYITLELPYNQAEELLNSLSSLVEKVSITGDKEKIKTLLEQLKKNTEEVRSSVGLGNYSNKMLHFTSVTIKAKFSELKSIVNRTIIPYITNSSALSIAHSVLEILKSRGIIIGDTKGYKKVNSDMNVEYNRLKSFEFFPKSKNKYATPENFAKHGFYYKPQPKQTKQADGTMKLTGIDKVIHFSSNIQIEGWDKLKDPLSELIARKPSSPFVQGKSPTNVPLSSTILSFDPIDCGELITDVISCDETNLVLTCNLEGKNKSSVLTLWYTKPELSLVYKFDASNGNVIKSSKDTNPSGSDSADGDLKSVILLPVKREEIEGSDSMEIEDVSKDNPQSEGDLLKGGVSGDQKNKWIDWCTNDIEVYITEKGLYPGAKGLVFDLVSKDTICVFLEGLNEVINFPLSQILPFKPKAQQRVKVLKGSSKGLSGLMLSLQGNVAIVRLDKGKGIISIDISSLASIPNSNGDDGGSTLEIEESCAVCFFSTANRNKITVYELCNDKPKYIQSLSVDGKGELCFSIYIESCCKIVAVFAKTKDDGGLVHHVVCFEFDVEGKRIKKVCSTDIEAKDRFVNGCSFIVERADSDIVENDGVALLKECGDLVLLNVTDLSVLCTLNNDDDKVSNYSRISFLKGDQRFVMLNDEGILRSAPLQVDIEENESENQDEEFNLDLTVDSLQSLSDFKMESIPLQCYPPLNVKQSIRSNNFVLWSIPSCNEKKEREDFTFEVELQSKRKIDSLDLEIGLERACIDESDLLSFGRKYAISLSIEDRQSWIKVLDLFDLTGLISSSNETKLGGKKRLGSLNLNVTARRLLVTLHNLMREEEKDKDKSVKRKFFSRKFEYFSDFDENGLLYWIGSNGGKDVWKNPHTTGKVTVSISHDKMYSGDMKKEHIIERNVIQSSYWGGTAPQFFIVDIGPDYSFVPSYYTLRHGYQHSNSFIQHWLFQASADLINWVTLHKGGETPFIKGFDTKTFKCKPTTTPFRYFKIMQKGNYSMGKGKQGGSAYICIAGFELYGELQTGSNIKKSPNSLSSLGMSLSSLLPPSPSSDKEIEADSIKKQRRKRSKFYKEKEFHKKLVKVIEEEDTDSKLRHLALDLLLDVWRRSTVSCEYILEAIDLEKFLKVNMIRADHQTAKRAGRLLAFYSPQVNSKKFKEKLLSSIISLLSSAVSECRQVGGLDQIFSTLRACFVMADSSDFEDDIDSENIKKKDKGKTKEGSVATKKQSESENVYTQALLSCVDLLVELGNKLYERRSPIYNLLRTHYGLYGFPLELNLFAPSQMDQSLVTTQTPTPVYSRISSAVPTSSLYSGYSSTTTSSTTSFNSLGSSSLDISKDSTQVLEQKLHVYSLEFAEKRRILTTLLEEIEISGDPALFTTRESEVREAYKNCIEAQFKYHSVCTKLKESSSADTQKNSSESSKKSDVEKEDKEKSGLVDGESKVDVNIDCTLHRWTYAAEKLFKCLNEQLENVINLDQNVLDSLFTNFCVYSTPNLRQEAAKFLMHRLGSQISFPSNTLKKFFSSIKNDKLKHSINLFPQQEVFKTLREIMSQERLRFFYLDDLFDLLEELLSSEENLDIQLVSWLLLLLSNIMPETTAKKSKRLLQKGESKREEKQEESKVSKLSKSVPDVSQLKKESEGQIQKDTLSEISSPSKVVGLEALGKSMSSIYHSPAASQPFSYENGENANKEPRMFLGRQIRTIFSLLSYSILLKPQCPELFLLATKVIESLAPHYSQSDLLSQIFKRTSFSEFLNRLLSYSSDFVRSTVLQMLQKLCNIDNESDRESLNSNSSFYGKAEQLSSTNGYEQPSSQIRFFLRSTVLSLLKQQLDKNPKDEGFSDCSNNVEFLLEILLITLTDSDEVDTKIDSDIGSTSSLLGYSSKYVGEKKESKKPSASTSDMTIPVLKVKEGKEEMKPGDDVCDRILELAENNIVRKDLKGFCLCLRVLRLTVRASKIFESLPLVMKVIREGILAPDEEQELFMDDFISFIKHLLSNSKDNSFERELIKVLSNTFVAVKTQEKSGVFSKIMDILLDDPKKIGSISFDVEGVVCLLIKISNNLPKQHKCIEDTSSEENKLLKKLLKLLNIIFFDNLNKDSKFKDSLIAEMTQKNHTFSHSLISWIGNTNNSFSLMKERKNSIDDSEPETNLFGISVRSAPSSSSKKDSKSPEGKTEEKKKDTLELILILIENLASFSEGAKHFLKLSLDHLRRRPDSGILVELILRIIKSEDTAYYFCVDLKGTQFLYEQIRSSNFTAASNHIFHTPAFSSFLLRGKNKLGLPSSSLSGNTKEKPRNQKITQFCELISPKNDKLALILKGKESTTPTIWSYNYNTKSSASSYYYNYNLKKDERTFEDKLPITIALPDNTVLKEIQIDAVNNHNQISRFPESVLVEIGSGLSRLFPVERFRFKSKPAQNPNTKYTSTFKFSMPKKQVVKYLRLRLKCPPNDNAKFIALSRIQIYGYSALTSSGNRIPESGVGVGSMFQKARLPLSSSLALLERCVSFDKFQAHVSKQKDTEEFSLFLLNIISAKTSSSVHKILLTFAKNIPTLADRILDSILSSKNLKPSIHASLAGKICCLVTSGENQPSNTIVRLNKLKEFVFEKLDNRDSHTLSHLIPFLDSLSYAIGFNKREHGHFDLKVSEKEVKLLFERGIEALNGSLMQRGILCLLSALVQSHPQHFVVLLDEFVKLCGDKDIYDIVTGELNQPLKLLGILSTSSATASQQLLKTDLPSKILDRMKNEEKSIEESSVVDSKGKMNSSSALKVIDEKRRFFVDSLDILKNISKIGPSKNWIGEYAYDVLFKLLTCNSVGSKVLYSLHDTIKSSMNLNETNQDKIASFLVKALRNSNANDNLLRLMLQFMSDVFAREDNVTICLHPIDNHIENIQIVNTISPKDDISIRLSRKYMHKNLDLEDDGLTVVANSNAQTGWRTILAEKPITSGVRKWSVIIEKCTTTANIMIGVCQLRQKLSTYIGQNNTAKGWSYYGATSGYTYHDGKSNSQYGQKMRKGDEIGVCLDMDEGTLSFSRNGEDLGIAYSTGFLGLELYPAVSLYDTGDRVRFKETEKRNIGRQVLGAYKISSGSSPLYYHRGGTTPSIFCMPTSTPLNMISNCITNDPRYFLEFSVLNKEDKLEFIKLPEPESSLKIGDILKKCDSGSEILDLNFEIKKKPEEEVEAILNSLNEDSESGVKDTVIPDSISELENGIGFAGSTLLKIFARKQGVSKLVELLMKQLAIKQRKAEEEEKRLEELKKKEEAELLAKTSLPKTSSPYSSMYYKSSYLSKTKRTVPIRKKEKKTKITLNEWKEWLSLLQILLKVDGFVNQFVESLECRSLLFSVMKEVSETSTEVNEISEKLGLKFQIPSPSEANISNPMSPVLKILFDLLNVKSCHNVEKPSSGDIDECLGLRKIIHDTGALGFILSYLVALSDIVPKDKTHPAFVDIVRKMDEKKKKKQKEQSDKKKRLGSDGKFWAKGTGFGTTFDDSVPQTWSHERYVKEQAIRAKKISQLLSGLECFLNISGTEGGNVELNKDIYDLFEASNIQPFMQSYLRNDSLLDLSRNMELYTALLSLLKALMSHSKLLPLLVTASKKSSESIYDLLNKLDTMASVILSRLDLKGESKKSSSEKDKKKEKKDKEKGIKSTSSKSKRDKKKSSKSKRDKKKSSSSSTSKSKILSDIEEIKLAKEIRSTKLIFKSKVEEWKKANEEDSSKKEGDSLRSSAGGSGEKGKLKLSDEYKKALKGLQFGEVKMADENGVYKHHYYTQIKSDKTTSPKKMKRLVQEISSLSTGLPLYLESSVFMRIDSDRMDTMKCIITGPEDTPYGNGCFLFDIYCPSEYPTSPPICNLETTGNNSVRFNPNLYNCGKVCLSLLGTWRGGPNEKWNENTSTLLQVLVSIQSLILVEKPYFNEPGYESSMNTPKGDRENRLYNENIRVATIKWAMTDQLQNPPPGFEEVIKTHFKLKRDVILLQCYNWIKEAKESSTPDHLNKLQKAVDDLKVELEKLDPNSPMEDPENITNAEDSKENKKIMSRWEKSVDLMDIIPRFPLGLYVKALELNEDKADSAVNWLFEKGENYLYAHTELWNDKPPLKNDKVEKALVKNKSRLKK